MFRVNVVKTNAKNELTAKDIVTLCQSKYLTNVIADEVAPQEAVSTILNLDENSNLPIPYNSVMREKF